MPDARLFRILLVGASGVFGSRLAERLAMERGLALTFAGRRRAPIEALVDRLGTGETRILDRDLAVRGDVAGFDLVIDAAGPFQDSATALIDAAIAAGVDYLDLADGRAWVTNFARFDRAARATGSAVMTGASSIPALSHAVLDQLTAGWRAIDSIRVTILPGNRAPRGRSVVEAILSYAGRSVRVFRDGAWRSEWGWGGLHRVDAGPAGRRWASLCDTPELDLLVTRYAPRRDALFFAGMELALLHLGLTLCSLPVRFGLLASLRPFARPMLAIAEWLKPLGSDRGAMLVEAVGEAADGRPVAARWRLNADTNRGPYVPVLAAVAMVRRWRDGDRPLAGAAICSGILTFKDFHEDFEEIGIRTTVD